MHLAKLRMTNWKCFRGDVELVLGPKVYAIVAHLQNDPESSNWLGKSSLGEAIRYALTGYLPEHIRLEDDWITRGQKKGEVELTFSTGERVLRSRTMGQSTKTYWNSTVMQAEAEKQIFETIKLTDEDFINTCYFEQKALSRIVTEKAAERLRIVGAWMQLEPLQHMHKWTAAQLTQTEKELAAARASADMCRFTVNEAVATLGIPDGAVLVPSEAGERTWFQGRMEGLEREIAQHEESLGTTEGTLLSINEMTKLAVDANRHKTVKYELLTLQHSIKPDAQKALKDDLEKRRLTVVNVSEKRGAVAREVSSRERLRVEGFSGTCPVACAPCPVPDYVAEQQETGALALSKAQDALKELTQTYETAAQNQTLAHEQLMTFERGRTRQAELENEEQRLRPVAEQFERVKGELQQELEPEDLRHQVHEYQEAINAARAEHSRVKTYGEAVEKAADALLEWEDRAEELGDKAATYREALVLLGPAGAQRRIAEGALQRIESGANVLLTRSSIPLTVKMEWSREGDDHAKTCEQCGAPFPKSARVKVCTRCGSERGKNIINKLEVRLSNWSGAATDLGGGAIQLAASAWLRRKRGSPWSTAILDEPFGSLDTAKRRAFAAHLVTMLGSEYGFAQSFIIAHHASVLDALPGRIVITSDGTYSTAKVAA